MRNSAHVGAFGVNSLISIAGDSAGKIVLGRVPELSRFFFLVYRELSIRVFFCHLKVLGRYFFPRLAIPARSLAARFQLE